MTESAPIPEDLKGLYEDARKYSYRWLRDLIERVAQLEAAVAELRDVVNGWQQKCLQYEGTLAAQQEEIDRLKGQLSGAQALADEKCKWFLVRAEKAEAEIAKLQARLDAMSARYAFHENQRLCVGDAGACDGDLEGTEHEEWCPARVLDMTLRPHLYDDAVSLKGHWQPLPSPPKEQL